MRETIVCIGKVGEKPYRFAETGAQISSYEELCYYLSRHMICYLYTLPGEDLLFYIRDELGLEKLYRQLSKFVEPDKDQMKFFSSLFREGHYFSEEEIRQILDEYRSLKNAPFPLQCKWLGDLHVKSHRSAMAIHYYKEALKRDDLEDAKIGTVYHNMGIAKAKLFRFHDAKVDFLKAYQYAGEEESLFYYYCIIAFTENLERAEEEVKAFKVTDLLLESFENRFAGLTDDFQYTSKAAKGNRIAFLKQKDKTEEADAVYHKFIHQLQKSFRQELDVEENLIKANVPVPMTGKS